MDSKIPKPVKLLASGALSLAGGALSKDLLNVPATEQRFGNGGGARLEVHRSKQRSRSVGDVARKDFHQTKLVPAKIKDTAGNDLLHPVSANTHRGDGLMGRSRAVGNLGKKTNVSSTSCMDTALVLEKNEQLTTALERSEAACKNYREKYTQSTKEAAALKCQMVELKERSNLLEAKNIALMETNKRIADYQEKYTQLIKEHAKQQCQIVELEERTNLLETKNVALVETNERITELLFQANIERKNLHNMVMDLRGNIRVFCRVRPVLPSEEHRTQCGWTFLNEQSFELLDDTGNPNEYSFDHVFQAHARQEDIFESVSPLIQSALDGYNVCIFAYGQTGSGKTYTMDGVPGNLGVIPRTADLIFNAINDYKRFGWEYEVRVYILEIYNEVLYDVLDTTGKKEHLEIKMTKNNSDLNVSNIIVETVESPAQLHQLISMAKKNLTTAATAGNECSSRSHVVTKISLIGEHREKGESCVGSVNLVDLASDESAKTSIRMEETKHINRSLSELRNVILARAQGNAHVPYRNSKLTLLLMPNLGGNSKTLMFVNVVLFQDCIHRSVENLKFACKVNLCKM